MAQAVEPVAAAPDATVAEVTSAPDDPAPEALLRAELKKWRSVPFLEHGTNRRGIGNPEFARAVFKGAFGTTIPASYGDQIDTGKLVDREGLAPGDLVFFEGQGFGPFKSKTVGIFLGHGQVALARKEDGVTTVKLNDRDWSTHFKTARRMPSAGSAAPAFDIAAYGANRAALLRDIGKAWSGTLYKAGGTTFDGIGNDEFVREVYGATYETDLPGDPDRWAKMGRAVSRDKLEPGDIVLYDPGGLGKFVSQRHAGLYIGNGEFVAAVKGSAVTILQLRDARWRAAFRSARRIDPDLLARAQRASARIARVESAGRGRGKLSTDDAAAAAVAGEEPAEAATAVRSEAPAEQRLRAVTAEWRGVPYRLGGNTRSGIDCSAFSGVLYSSVYTMQLPRTALEQEALGRAVDRAQLQPGDLVFFRTQGMGPLFKSRHVGVYLGGGEFAQASGRFGVTISRLDNAYWNKKYHGARRINKTQTS